jgi:hypothetical protein
MFYCAAFPGRILWMTPHPPHLSPHLFLIFTVDFTVTPDAFDRIEREPLTFTYPVLGESACAVWFHLFNTKIVWKKRDVHAERASQQPWGGWF